MSAARRWFASRRTPLAATLIVILIFVAAVALWAGSNDDEGAATPPPSFASSNAVPNPSGPSGATASNSERPSAGGSATATGLPTLPGLAGARLPDRTQLTTLGPGNHRVVMRARSDQPMLAVSYAVKGDKTSRTFSNVKSPVVVARTIAGDAPLATIALQIGPTATRGSCTITIDGKIVSSQRVSTPYAVTQCVG